jgi:lysophospholipase L1-like esterase
MIFDKGDQVVFIGDSITDAGRTTSAAPYGKGYVSLLRAFVTAQAPELGLRWANRGVSGNTVRDLAARWQTDVIDTRPDWLSVSIGINDCWRGIRGEPGTVPVAEYQDTLHDLLREAVRQTGCRLIVATPYLIGADPVDPWRTSSDTYVRAAREVAHHHDALLVDTQQAFDRAVSHTAPADWAEDRIHPNLPGHAVIAQAFLDVLRSAAAPHPDAG